MSDKYLEEIASTMAQVDAEKFLKEMGELNKEFLARQKMSIEERCRLHLKEGHNDNLSAGCRKILGIEDGK